MKKLFVLLLFILMFLFVIGAFWVGTANDTTLDSTEPTPPTPPPPTPNYLHGFDIVKPYKTVYIEGEILDLTGFEYYVTYGAMYSDGTYEELSRGKVEYGNMIFNLADKPFINNGKPIDEPLTVDDKYVNMRLRYHSGGSGPDGCSIAVTVHARGDVNGDGVVDDGDLLRLLQYLSGWDVEIAPGADVNGDGVVDDHDILRLMQYLTGWDVVLGAVAPETT